MVQSVLVVCVGNICRSPLGERLLLAHLGDSDIRIGSAGIGALVGHGADDLAAEVAAQNGVSLDGHSARQFTPELGAAHELILVMEPGHRREIERTAPQLLGRTMLFDQWTGAKGIADPYRKSRAFHEKVYGLVEEAARAWAGRLSLRGRASR